MTRLSRASLGSGERLGTFTPLATRFWDQTAGRPVADDIETTLQVRALRGARVRGRRTPSSFFVFHDVPGLAGEQAGGESATREYLMVMRDRRERFVPVHAVVTLPRPIPDPVPALLPFTSSRVEQHLRSAGVRVETRMFLASSPMRTTPAGFVGLRGQLHDGGKPAAHARVRVGFGVAHGAVSESRFGITDAEGSFLVIVPRTPRQLPPAEGNGEPAGEDLEAPELRIEVQYSGELEPALPGLPPDYLAILQKQPARSLVDADGNVQPALTVLEPDEREIVLKSKDAEGEPRGVLRLAPKP